jgi:quercetin dioxygenase-like cupin family protein
MPLAPGITRADTGLDAVVWSILGHTYWLKAECESCFIFETFDPPGSFVPPHIHPTQDEFIWVLEGELDLILAGQRHKARPGDLVRMPLGIAHGYYNNGTVPARALFWVTPARKLRQLFDALHNLTDMEEAVRLSRLHEVEFLPPP